MSAGRPFKWPGLALAGLVNADEDSYLSASDVAALAVKCPAERVRARNFLCVLPLSVHTWQQREGRRYVRVALADVWVKALEARICSRERAQ